MREPYLKNPELRRFLGFQLLSVVIIGTATCVAVAGRMRVLDREIAGRIAAAAGSVAESYPEAARRLTRELAAAFSTRAAPSLESATRAGITPELLLAGRRAVFSALPALAAVGAGATLLLLASSILILYLAMRGLLGRIRAVSRAADLVVDGSPSPIPELDTHGDVGELAERFNRMARRVTVTAARLERERQNMELLISDVSHQLKTPLSSIKLMTDLMLQGSATGPKAQEFMSRTIHEVERMEWLIRSLLALARIEAGALTFRRADGDLRETIEDAASGVRELASARGVRIAVTAPEVRIAHDSRWLSEALGNVIKNCAEHSPERGVVTVSVSDTPAVATVEIHDDGAGIPAEDLPRLFTRFYRGRDATEEGSGIGLSLAKAVIEGHDGSIGVSSMPSQGSTFTIMLPRSLAGSLTEP